MNDWLTDCGNHWPQTEVTVREILVGGEHQSICLKSLIMHFTFIFMLLCHISQSGNSQCSCCIIHEISSFFQHAGKRPADAVECIVNFFFQLFTSLQGIKEQFLTVIMDFGTTHYFHKCNCCSLYCFTHVAYLHHQIAICSHCDQFNLLIL